MHLQKSNIIKLKWISKLRQCRNAFNRTPLNTECRHTLLCNAVCNFDAHSKLRRKFRKLEGETLYP